jgi:hypothetical protein
MRSFEKLWNGDASRELFWHIGHMKALKSKLASELLSDPQAREQLRTYLINKGPTGIPPREAATGRFTIRSRAGSIRVDAMVVPKAA